MTPRRPARALAAAAFAAAAFAAGACSTCRAPPPAPPETAEPVAPLRWSMTRVEAAAALRGAGLEVVEHAPTKTPEAWISAKRSDARDMTVSFDDDGRMSQVVVAVEPIPCRALDGAADALRARFGAPASERRSLEHHATAADGSVVRVYVSRDDAGSYVLEEHAVGDAKAGGAVRTLAGDLAWGAPEADVVARLGARGFTARFQSTRADSCAMPNPPPDCRTSGGRTLAIRRADAEGTAEIAGARGLAQITVRTHGFADDVAARARAAELAADAAPGVQVVTVDTFASTFESAATEAILERRRRAAPSTTCGTIETYRRRP